MGFFDTKTANIIIYITGVVLPLIILFLQWSKLKLPYGLIPMEEYIFGGSVVNIIILNVIIYAIIYGISILLLGVCPDKDKEKESKFKEALAPAGYVTGCTCLVMLIPWILLTLGEEHGGEIPFLDEGVRLIMGNMIGQFIIFCCAISPILTLWYNNKDCSKDDKKK